MHELLVEMLNNRALSVGFVKIDPVLSERQDIALPYSYWELEYASMLLVNLSGLEMSAVREWTRRSELFLDDILVNRERPGVVVDGYLVIALSSNLKEVNSFISDIEKNTRFVRKHVVLDVLGEWKRIERITVVGIAPVLSSDEIAQFPEMDIRAKRLVEDIDLLGSLALAEKHGKEWDLND